MYNPMPNYLSSSLARDNEFLKMSETVLLNLFDSNEKIHASNTGKKEFTAKIFSNKDHKLNYLLVKKEGQITVYEEPIYSWEKLPFDYAIKELKSGSYEIHAREIMSILLTNGDDDELMAMAKVVKKHLKSMFKNNLSQDEKKEVDKVLEQVKADPELEKKVMKKLQSIYGDEFKCNSNPYKLKVFFEYLYNQGLISEMISDDKWIEKNQPFNDYASEPVDQLKTDINFLFEVCDKNKFTSKKKYQFNDADNFLYAHNGGMVVESQGLGAYITMKGEEITVYAFDKENEGFLKYTNLSKLVESIKNGKDSLIDSVILKINQDKVEYVNANTWYCFSSDLENTRKSIIEEELGEMSYPIDIQSFEYQLKYSQQNYGFTKFEFLANKFMIYGAESNYDKTLGIFTNEDITYNKNIADSTIKVDEEKTTEFSYCIPIKKIPYLQKEWLEGLEYLVDVLKTDAPIPTVSNTKDKVQDVKDAVLHFEKMIPKLKAKLNETNKLKM